MLTLSCLEERQHGRVLVLQNHETSSVCGWRSQGWCRMMGTRCQASKPHQHGGLLALLLAHQHRVNQHIQHPGSQALQHALLLALEALLACPTFPPSAVPGIALSGRLKAVLPVGTMGTRLAVRSLVSPQSAHVI